MSGRFGLMLPIFVVGAVLMMVIPVSPLVLDLLLTFQFNTRLEVFYFKIKCDYSIHNMGETKLYTEVTKHNARQIKIYTLGPDLSID